VDGDDETPSAVSSLQAENSDVFPSASVAVAVSTGPEMLAKAVVTLPDPEASVVRVVVPRGVSPSPKPVSSQAWLEKSSTVKLELGRLFRVALMAAPPLLASEVRTG
jgi:hypothetical protein